MCARKNKHYGVRHFYYHFYCSYNRNHSECERLSPIGRVLGLQIHHFYSNDTVSFGSIISIEEKKNMGEQN